MTKQHEKTIGRLSTHEDLLKQVLYHCSSLDVELGSMMEVIESQSESAEFPSHLNEEDVARSRLASPPLGSADGSSSPTPSIFNSYTQHDLDLRQGAQKVHSRMSVFQTERSVPQLPPLMQRVVGHPGFDIFFGMVVVTNSIFLGIDVQMRIGEPVTPPPMKAACLEVQKSVVSCWT